MTPEEDTEDDHGGHWGVCTCHFYDQVGHDVGAEDNAEAIDPHERHVGRTDTDPEDFARAHDLDG